MDLSFRGATAAESAFLADTMVGDPGQETTRVAMALYGIDDPARLLPLFRVLGRSGENWKDTELAIAADRRVGLLQTGSTSVRITPGVVSAVTRVLGLRVLRVPGRLRIQQRIAPPKPDGSMVISEIHVVPGLRGRGVGDALLAHAESRARVGEYRCIALHTLATNPARRLYERHGYRAVLETTDRRFERLTGVTGNVLYVKDLDRG